MSQIFLLHTKSEKKLSSLFPVKDDNDGCFSHKVWWMCWLGIRDGPEDSAVRRGRGGRHLFSASLRSKRKLLFLEMYAKLICWGRTGAANLGSFLQICQEGRTSEQLKTPLTYVGCTFLLPHRPPDDPKLPGCWGFFLLSHLSLWTLRRYEHRAHSLCRWQPQIWPVSSIYLMSASLWKYPPCAPRAGRVDVAVAPFKCQAVRNDPQWNDLGAEPTELLLNANIP